MTSRSIFVSSAAVAVVGVLLAPNAALAGEAPNFLMTWDASGDQLPEYSYNWAEIDGNPGGIGADPVFGKHEIAGETVVGWRYSGTWKEAPFGDVPYEFAWDCVFNVTGGAAGGSGGAFVIAQILSINNDPLPQDFGLTMTLPVAPVITNPFQNGSIVGTVSDADFDGANVSALANDSIYTSFIDNTTEETLMDDPFDVSAPPFGSSPVGPADFGLPNNIPASQDVDVNIGITLHFRLTGGGDSASFTSRFEVVPAPAGLPLLAAFGLLAGRRRRR